MKILQNKWKINMENKELLTISQTGILKGIMALGIVLYHLAVQYNDNLIVLKPFKYLGFLFVGLFFFISGYGLTVSMLTKKDYFSSSKKRFLKVIIPFINAIIVYTIYYSLQGEILKQNIFFVVKYCWFIYEILALYIVFFITYKKFSFKKATILNSIIILISLILMYFFKISATWYKSTLAFLVGIIVAKNRENLVKWINSKYYIKTFVLIISMGIFLSLGKYLELGILEILIYNIAVMLFIVVCLMLIAKLMKFENKFLKYLGCISFEIYLYHGLFIDLFLRIPINKNIGGMLIIIFSIIMAIIMNKFDKIIINKIFELEKIKNVSNKI